MQQPLFTLVISHPAVGVWLVGFKYSSGESVPFRVAARLSDVARLGMLWGFNIYPLLAMELGTEVEIR
jgi:hypothetical protein